MKSSLFVSLLEIDDNTSAVCQSSAQMRIYKFRSGLACHAHRASGETSHCSFTQYWLNDCLKFDFCVCKSFRVIEDEIFSSCECMRCEC